MSGGGAKEEKRMSNKMREMCKGCFQDYYNQNRDGGCWLFNESKVVTRTQVGTWQNPPYSWSPEQTLSCHTAPQGRSWIAKDDPRIVMAKIK